MKINQMRSEIDSCAVKDNTIYFFGDQDIQYLKISIDLFKKTNVAPFFEDNFRINCPMNKDGYLIIWYEEWRLWNILFEALKFYKLDFEFDESTLQKIYDNLDEKEQDEIAIFSDEELEDIGISSEYAFPVDLSNHFDDIFDPSWGTYGVNYIHDVHTELEEDDIINYEKSLREEKIKKQNIESKYKRRKTKYKKLGCEILNGHDALKSISQSFTHSMIALNTDEIYSIEYSGSAHYCSDLDDADYYTVRKIIDGKIKKEVLWWFMLPNVFEYEWAIKEYHTGIYFEQPDY